ncbi:MAG: tRNA (guanosine(46)-N7)-methyltransferase TrmB [Francisellaceae bacterium]
MSDDPRPPQKPLRTIKSYVKRAGRVTKLQQYALEHYADHYLIPYQSQIDVDTLFAQKQPLIVEIGFGMGTSLIEMAQRNPHFNYLGIEVHEAGVGNILDKIHTLELANIMVIQHDAVDVLKHKILDNTLFGLQIFFPDPWHKKRHHKRRLINAEFIELLTLKLEKKGFIHFASDWQHYADEVLALFKQNPSLTNAHEGFAPRPESRPLTKFEQRGQRLNHGVWDIIVHKK